MFLELIICCVRYLSKPPKEYIILSSNYNHFYLLC